MPEKAAPNVIAEVRDNRRVDKDKRIDVALPQRPGDRDVVERRLIFRPPVVKLEEGSLQCRLEVQSVVRSIRLADGPRDSCVKELVRESLDLCPKGL